jgi:hypothetical protein
MLYEEFLAGTKAKETKDTYRQYELLETIYRDCEDVTKEDVYKVWKQTYGKQAKIERERILTNIRAMSEFERHDEKTQNQKDVCRKLYEIGKSIEKTNDFQAGFTGKIETPDGVTYMLREYRQVNFHRVCKMVIAFEGKEYETQLNYMFGDFYVTSA